MDIAHATLAGYEHVPAEDVVWAAVQPLECTICGYLRYLSHGNLEVSLCRSDKHKSLQVLLGNLAG